MADDQPKHSNLPSMLGCLLQTHMVTFFLLASSTPDPWKLVLPITSGSADKDSLARANLPTAPELEFFLFLADPCTRILASVLAKTRLAHGALLSRLF